MMRCTVFVSVSLGEGEMFNLGHRLRQRFAALLAKPYFPSRFQVVSTHVSGEGIDLAHPDTKRASLGKGNAADHRGLLIA